jgi:multiple sugar transport system permease protein
MTTTTEVLPIGSAVKKPRKRPRYNPFVLWLVPILGHVFLFSIFPIFASFFMAFTDVRLNQSNFQFVGLGNIIEALTRDHVFIRSLQNTLYYSFVSVPLGMAISLLLAQLIFNRKYYQSAFRTVYFLPVVTPFIATVIIWRFFLQPSQFGILNSLLGQLGIHAQPWLRSTTQVIPSIILISIWGGLGYNLVLFLAGLGGIPVELYEAAKIDGANSWQLFWRITWPLLAPVVLFTTVTGSIGAMQIYGVPQILTGGGPEDASRVILMHITQQGFQYFRMGYASSLAMITFIIIMLLAMIQLRFLRNRYNY